MPRMPQAKPDLVVVAWYSRENYDAVRALGKDGGGLQATFDQWREQAETQIASIVSRGIRVERIEIDPSQLTAWLRAENVECNEQTRAAFVHHLASAKYADKH